MLARRDSSGPTVVEVRNVSKTFRIPKHRVDTLKERAIHPLRRVEYGELHALENVSLDIARGEFVGIAGRNGSGKTTLLKLLASIYRADAGTIRIAGRLAPFIELGVGFNPSLAARENVLLNAVMMGLSPALARERVDEVIEFAELEDFVELALKNYSSGMRVRLGFSVMVHADADILLIDEVLAVGDAAFQQKCADTFFRLRDEGRTLILVTHDMASLEEYCDRAILLHEGRVAASGVPDEVAREYMSLNFGRRDGGPAPLGDRDDPLDADGGPPVAARISSVWLESSAGERIDTVGLGEPIRLLAEIEACEDVEGPAFSFQVRNPEGQQVFSLPIQGLGGSQGLLRAGERSRIAFTVENPLSNGHYYIDCGLCRNENAADMVDYRGDAYDFVVYGIAPAPGIVLVDYECEVERIAPRSEEHAAR